MHAMVVTHLCDSWTFYLLFTCMPMYLKEVLKFDIQNVSTLIGYCKSSIFRNPRNTNLVSC